MSNLASDITIEETVQNRRTYFNTDETKARLIILLILRLQPKELHLENI